MFHGLPGGEQDGCRVQGRDDKRQCRARGVRGARGSGMLGMQGEQIEPYDSIENRVVGRVDLRFCVLLEIEEDRK